MGHGAPPAKWGIVEMHVFFELHKYEERTVGDGGMSALIKGCPLKGHHPPTILTSLRLTFSPRQVFEEVSMIDHNLQTSSHNKMFTLLLDGIKNKKNSDSLKKGGQSKN